MAADVAVLGSDFDFGDSSYYTSSYIVWYIQSHLCTITDIYEHEYLHKNRVAKRLQSFSCSALWNFSRASAVLHKYVLLRNLWVLLILNLEFMKYFYTANHFMSFVVLNIFFK